MYDEMHVDGNASTSLFVAPAAAYFALLDQRSLDGARVYVLINGQIIEAPETTPFKLRTDRGAHFLGGAKTHVESAGRRGRSVRRQVPHVGSIDVFAVRLSPIQLG